MEYYAHCQISMKSFGLAKTFADYFQIFHTEPAEKFGKTQLPGGSLGGLLTAFENFSGCSFFQEF